MTSPWQGPVRCLAGFFVVISTSRWRRRAAVDRRRPRGGPQRAEWVTDLGRHVRGAAARAARWATGSGRPHPLRRDDRVHARLARLRRPPWLGVLVAAGLQGPRRRSSSPPRCAGPARLRRPRRAAKGIATWAATGGILVAAGPVVGGVPTSAAMARDLSSTPVGAIAVSPTSAAALAAQPPRSTSPARARRCRIGVLPFAVIEAGTRARFDARAHGIRGLRLAALVARSRRLATPRPVNVPDPDGGDDGVPGCCSLRLHGQVSCSALLPARARSQRAGHR